MRLTENLIANIVLPDKVTKKLFIHTSLIDNLCIRLAPSSISCNFPRYQLTAVSQNVHPSSIAFNKTGSASSRLKLLPSPKLRPIAPKPGDGTWISPKGSVLTIFAIDS